MNEFCGREEDHISHEYGVMYYDEILRKECSGYGVWKN